MTKVAEFLASTIHLRRDVMLTLREIILPAAPGLHERIKRNAPSYTFGGDDRITFNLSRPEVVQIVFHLGVKAVDTKTGKRLVDDDSGFLGWATDQRASVSFAALAEVTARRNWLAKFVRQWLAAVPA